MRVRIGRTVKLLSYLFVNLTLSDIMRTLKSTLFKNDLIYVFAIDIETIPESVLEAKLDLGEENNKVILKKGEIEELEEFSNRTGEIAWEFNCHRFDGVKEFFIARDPDMIRHIAWIYKSNDTNRYMILGERDALLQYGLTLQQFRGQGLAPAVQKEVMRYLKAKGIKRMFSLVESHNQASIRSLEKGGFVKVGRVRFVKVFGLQVSKKLNVAAM